MTWVSTRGAGARAGLTACKFLPGVDMADGRGGAARRAGLDEARCSPSCHPQPRSCDSSTPGCQLYRQVNTQNVKANPPSPSASTRREAARRSQAALSASPADVHQPLADVDLPGTL